MAVAWFICPIDQLPEKKAGLVIRQARIFDFHQTITDDGGKYTQAEVLGNRALCKVNASQAVLDTINAATGFRRIPQGALDRTLGELTNAQRNAIRNEILDAGYTVQELNARFPNWQDATIRQALKFLATRRFKPRLDASENVVLDGPIQPCGDPDKMDDLV